MASITLTIGSLTTTKTISTADLNRVVAAFKARYGASLTNQQAFDIWAAGSLASLQDIVRNEEIAASNAATAAAFVPVSIT